jgi:glucose/mannose transport system permease protein
MVREMGFENFSFDWLVNTDMAIYTVVIAGVWQSSGFVMALCLAGLRGVDENIVKAARVDGASMPLIYRKIIIPGLRPVFFSALIVLTHIAIKSFDLIVALTGGGPGYATDVPATFMYTYAFTRGQIGLGSAASMMMLMAVVAIFVPYLYSELRERNNEH